MTQPKKILIADDNEAWARAIVGMIEPDFQREGLPKPLIRMVNSMVGALEAMKRECFDFILIDRGLPLINEKYRRETTPDDGEALAQSIKRRGVAPDMCKDIQGGNRKAIVVLCTGMGGYSGRSIPGVDIVLEKETAESFQAAIYPSLGLHSDREATPRFDHEL